MRRAVWILALLAITIAGCGVDWFPLTAPDAPTSVTVTADPASPLANTTVTLKANVKQSNGTAVPDGTAVSLTTTGGTLSSTSATTTGGTATVTLTSTTAGSFTVTATAGTASGKVVVIFQPLLTVTANPSSLSAVNGGSSSITATVKKADGTAAADGTTVTFTVTGGAVVSPASATTTGGTGTATTVLTITPGTISGSSFIITASEGTNTNTVQVTAL